MSKLKYLDLSENPLTDLPHEVFLDITVRMENRWKMQDFNTKLVQRQWYKIRSWALCNKAKKRARLRHMRTKCTTTQYIRNGWMESTWECAEYLQNIFFLLLSYNLCVIACPNIFFSNMWTLQTIHFGIGTRYLQNDKQLVEENYRYFIALLCTYTLLLVCVCVFVCGLHTVYGSALQKSQSAAATFIDHSRLK